MTFQPFLKNEFLLNNKPDAIILIKISIVNNILKTIFILSKILSKFISFLYFSKHSFLSSNCKYKKHNLIL